MAGSGWKEPLGPLGELRGGKRNELMVDSLVRRHFSIEMLSYVVREGKQSRSGVVMRRHRARVRPRWKSSNASRPFFLCET